ncbi:MAG: chromosomal replication initiation protein DnaA [Anaerolineae bacterium UTCFX2]|jgi:chromosomal replication initiator protein|nr:chromosomal replication initiator protein DnaA [Anaerolineales bacterium]OQY90969.1 MAG: chromosomal replication initiation protein DnaA [Anaerolineae bacterium UTCFX2]
MNAHQAWQATHGQLQTEMPKAAFDTWVKNAEFISYEDGDFIIGVPNAYARDWLHSRLSSTVTRLLTGIMNRSVKVRFVVWNNVSDQSQRAALPERELEYPEGDLFENQAANTSLNARYTFQNFVVGPSNRLAHAASMAVAEKPAQAYNPLFLYGGVGLGKTHLLHAIGNLCHRQGLQALYVSSEVFTNDLINAIRTHTTQAFREKYRSIDVLLVDDIQFIAGKESTQEEFFHTFNTLHGQDKQIVVSSDRPPKALVTLEERLCSRFEWGLTADIQPPDLETRQAILRSKADRLDCDIPIDLMEMIARRVQSNIRELEGALTRVAAFADLSGLPVTPQLIETALGDMLPRRTEADTQEVIRKVAEAFGITVEGILSRDRSRQVALPRQVAMYLLREEANVSLPQIGEALGGRDHTTVMYGCEKISDLLEQDARFKRQVLEIKERLYGSQAMRTSRA